MRKIDVFDTETVKVIFDIFTLDDKNVDNIRHQYLSPTSKVLTVKFISSDQTWLIYFLYWW